MRIRDMLCLVSEQLEVINAVIRRVTVYMVNNLAWFKIPTYVLLHYVTVFKDIFSTRWFDIRWVRMTIINYHHNISILTNFTTTVPLSRFVFGSTIHGIITSKPTNTIHRVIYATYVSMIGRIGVGKITGGYSTTNRTIFPVRIGFVLPVFFATLCAFVIRTTYFGLTSAFYRAVFRLYRRISLIFFVAVFACSGNHRLNYTTGW